VGVDLRLVRIAAVAALLGALALAGCGRKAGLDPPPASAVSDPTTIGTEPQAPPAIGPDGKPIAPPTGKKRWLPIDVLVD
jgi:predicted small lipoprotein YifL